MSFIGARVAIKTSDGKFLCIDDKGSLKLKVCNNDLDPAITFSVPLAVNNVFVQAYTREFVSVNNNGEIVLVPCNHPLSEQESFNFLCLGMNRVAIQAHNGKFISTGKENKKKGTLLANSVDISDEETFEVILIFR
jgi:hypothetical protein